MTNATGILSIVAAVGVMTGLERQYGISRSAILSVLPERACIRRVLDRVPEIEAVKELDPPGRTELQRFRYEGRGFWAYVSVGTQADGKILFVHERITVNEKPQGEELKETHRVMLLVEQSLAARCGMDELAAGVQEDWIGVKRPD